MKNSNRNKEIFGPKENLSISDIESYKEAKSESQNSIEQKLQEDPFAQDAMEGWKSMSYDTSSIEDIKSNLFQKGSFHWYTAIGATIVGVVSVLFIQNLSQPNKVATTKQTQLIEGSNAEIANEINIESTDIILPASIQEMQNAPEEDQLIAKTIKEDFASMEDIKIEFTPLDPIVIENTMDKTIISSRSNAKEIYLHDFKLIDYSHYKAKPVVHAKQLILTGTTADKEHQNSETFDSNWENIEIPYSEYLEKSIYYFNKGRTKKSLARFETIIDTYKDDVNANFYGALCYFNLSEYKSAIKHFETCLQSEYSNFDEEAIWITALSYEKLNQSNEAKKLFEEISKNGSYYSQQAKEKLK